MDKNGAPIFVVGFARSGTTLLQSLLGAHSRIAAPPEIGFFGRVWDYRDVFGDLSDDEALRRVLHTTVSRPLLSECGFDEDALFERLRAQPRSYAAVLDTVLSDFAARNGKVRWSEKTPMQDPGLIWHHFPDGLILHIVREPRETVASNLKLPWVDESAAFIARWWQAFTSSAIYAGADRGSRQYLRIRYEDLAREPEATMRLVCSFIGEQFEPEMVTDLARRTGTVPDSATEWIGGALKEITQQETSWRQTLSFVDRARVSQIVFPLMPGLGYPQPQRKTLLVGATVNGMYRPVDELKRWRKRQAVRKSTPEQRMNRHIAASQRKQARMGS